MNRFINLSFRLVSLTFRGFSLSSHSYYFEKDALALPFSKNLRNAGEISSNNEQNKSKIQLISIIFSFQSFWQFFLLHLETLSMRQYFQNEQEKPAPVFLTSSRKIRTLCFPVHPRISLGKVYKPSLREIAWRLKKQSVHLFLEVVKNTGAQKFNKLKQFFNKDRFI